MTVLVQHHLIEARRHLDAAARLTDQQRHCEAAARYTIAADAYRRAGLSSQAAYCERMAAHERSHSR